MNEKKYKKIYRIEVADNETHRSLFVFRKTPVFIVSLLVSTFLLIFTTVVLLFFFTPVKQLIPGYPSPQTREIAIMNAIKVDSLEREIQLWTLQLTNIQKIITGQAPINIDSLIKEDIVVQEITNIHSKDDSILRLETQKAERFSLNFQNLRVENIEGLLFFVPVKGIISEGYNEYAGHPYVDIATTEGAMAYSVLDGTIIATFWDDNTGYNIQIQHDNNLISVYKHNVKLFKEIGDKVTAGTPISSVGDIGTLSTGSHLHFELWHKGEPIDPTKYINF